MDVVCPGKASFWKVWLPLEPTGLYNSQCSFINEYPLVCSKAATRKPFQVPWDYLHRWRNWRWSNSVQAIGLLPNIGAYTCAFGLGVSLQLYHTSSSPISSTWKTLEAVALEWQCHSASWTLKPTHLPAIQAKVMANLFNSFLAHIHNERCYSLFYYTCLLHIHKDPLLLLDTGNWKP